MNSTLLSGKAAASNECIGAIMNYVFRTPRGKPIVASVPTTASYDSFIASILKKVTFVDNNVGEQPEKYFDGIGLSDTRANLFQQIDDSTCNEKITKNGSRFAESCISRMGDVVEARKDGHVGVPMHVEMKTEEILPNCGLPSDSINCSEMAYVVHE